MSGHQVKRLRYIVNAFPLVTERHGGVIRSILKASCVLKKHGLSGLRDSWRRGNSPIATMQYISDGTLVNVNDYSDWLRRYGNIDADLKQKIIKTSKNLRMRPLISIIMPVYNPNIVRLTDSIESVRQQLYGNWQLCIAGDQSTGSDVRELLARYCKKDKRIHVVYVKENGHVSRASNSAIQLATGEWLALLDQDDLLAPEALFCVAKAINNNDQAAIVYSDEDKIDEKGVRFDPYFKSDWNQDLFISQNMICHLGAYRADLVDQVGAFRSEYAGSQNYDLALRISEVIAPTQIVHIPRILYHWRSVSKAAAELGNDKNYALAAGQRALNDHFRRTKVQADVETLDIGVYRTKYHLPNPLPLVSLIIPTRNGLSLLKQCISSILEKTLYDNYEIIVIDNNSDDPQILEYFTQIKWNPKIRVLKDERPFNYSAINNNAVKYAKGQYIGLINNDIEVISPGWLSEMIALAVQPGVGAVGACLWYPNDTMQHGGVIMGIGGVAGHAHSRITRGQSGYFCRARVIQSLSAVTAACLVVKKSIYIEVGGLNETELTIAFNDVDFCLKVKEFGYRNVWTPFAELYHHESASRGYEDTPEKQRRFEAEVNFMRQRWATDTILDPAYNPNLTIERDDFSLAWPPRFVSTWLV